MTTKTKPSALETMRHQLMRIQQAENECKDQYGNIKPCMKEKYDLLVKEAKNYYAALEIWERVFNYKNHDRS